MKRIVVFLSIIAMLFASCSNKDKTQKTSAEGSVAEKIVAGESDLFMLVGTYTSDKGSKGIYVYRFNTDSGKADSVSMVETENPSYLTISPDSKFVYAVEENGEKHSAAHAFSFDKSTGILKHLNKQLTMGADPCYITIDPKGKTVFTANYSGGSISSFQVEKDGSLLPINTLLQFHGSSSDKDRQTSSHLHSVRYSPDGQYIFAADLGADKIYRLTPLESPFKGQPSVLNESLKEFPVPVGTGPRHFDFHPNGRYVYLLGELSGQVIVFDYSSGILTQKQTIASDTVGAHGSADIHVSPDGRFVYASNRLKADGIAIFTVNPDDGKLTKIGYQPTGLHPRNFAITPNGKYLLVACRDDNKIQVFSIDPKTGLLSDTHQDIQLSKPVCVKFTSM
ncbi:MAG: lactonase family protein [Bacteroidota bacterium]